MERFPALPAQFEWLCDNFYIIERAAKTSVHSINTMNTVYNICKKKSVHLCMENNLENGSKNSLENAVILSSAKEYMKLSSLSYKTNDTVCFLNGIQTLCFFTTEELYSFFPLLKLSFISELADICNQMYNELSSVIKSSFSQTFDHELSTQLNEKLSAVIHSLKDMEKVDFEKWFKSVSNLESLLNNDPAGIYPGMSEMTKSQYRKRTEQLSVKFKQNEITVAQNALNSAKSATELPQKHIGHWLYNDNASIKKEKLLLKRLYLSLLLFLPLFCALICGIFIAWWMGIILLFPLYESSKYLLDQIFTRFIPSVPLPRMDLSDGIPDRGKTLAVISTLLTDIKKVPALCNKLELFYNANPDKNLAFGILADFADNKHYDSENDEKITNAAVDGIEKLNKKYGNKFYFFIRKRTYNEKQSCFMGWERKRGAIVNLVSFILGKNDIFLQTAGDINTLRECKYLLTLDSDTDLLTDNAKDMLSAMLHPLNFPVEKNGRVISGYGIISPCIEVDVDAASKNNFTRYTSGVGGVDSYSDAVGDIYQDLFGEGIFTGKGLINIKLFDKYSRTYFKENAILSHDILEGGLLRAGYMSDIKLTDGYPSALSSYFDRLNRWIRGDYQNIGWIFPRVKNGKGKSVKNPLNLLTRFKLLDNLRRPLTSVFTVAVILSAFTLTRTQSAISLVIAVLWTILPLFMSLVESIINDGLRQIFRIYFSNLIGGIKGTFTSSLTWIIMLPHTAKNALDAVLRSFWRAFVSNKKMLTWVTAEASEAVNKNKNSVFAYYKRMWLELFCVSFVTVYAVILRGFESSAYLCVFTSVWLMSPFFASFVSKTEKANSTQRDKQPHERTLKRYSKDIWRFFDENMSAKTSYLPPDNVQEKPVYRIAMRTSPTNIGLGLLSILSARDLNLIDSEKLYVKLEKSFATITVLEKWEGHLLNWYELGADPSDCRPLNPRYVSTVDSGNLLACLYTLSAGLKEYLCENEGLRKIISTADELCASMDFSKLYDKKKELFHIGYNLVENRLEGMYDMFMSEARTVSFMSIALRIADKKHWSALSRPLIKSGRHIGYASWSGTMFEYMMPHIFLPIYKASAGYEAIKSAYREQVLRGKRIKKPWGISESGFYSFDALYNYQYKAFGVGKLGFMRGLDEEKVISPYSSFLALHISEKGALSNLKKLEEAGYYGKYGFYEAIDFTPSRVGMGEGLVRSYMSHHLGMSLLSALNSCRSNIIQKRFMSHPQLLSAAHFLKERVPTGAVIHEKSPSREFVRPLSKEKFYAGDRKFEKIQPFDFNDMHVLSNGETSLFASSNGYMLAKNKGLSIIKAGIPTQAAQAPQGFFMFAKNNAENNTVSTSAVLNSLINGRFPFENSAEFHNDSIIYNVKNENLDLTQKFTVSPESDVIFITASLRNRRSSGKDASLFIYFEPCMSTDKDYNAHPVYSNLFIESFYDKEEGALLFKRRQRTDKTDEEWLCFASEAFFSEQFTFETRRQKALPRLEGIHGLTKKINNISKLSNFTGACIDPALFACIITAMSPKETKTVNFALSSATSKSEAVIIAKNALKKGFERTCADFTRGKEAVYQNTGFEENENNIMNRLLPFLTGTVENKAYQNHSIPREFTRSALSLGQKQLWSHGVSGDIPVIVVEIDAMESAVRAKSYLKVHRMLKFCGCETDLILLYNEEESYNSPFHSALLQVVRLYSSVNFINRHGGIFLINDGAVSAIDITLIKIFACVYEKAGSINTMITSDVKQPSLSVINMPVKQLDDGSGNPYLTVTGKSVEINNSPSVPWGHIIANPMFGTFISDKSLGFTWAYNARENKLTPWDNDTVYDNSGERLILCVNEKQYDIMSSVKKAVYDQASAVYYCVLNAEKIQIKLKVTVSVADKLPFKMITVESFAFGDEGKAITADMLIFYEIIPQLGFSRNTRRFISILAPNDGINDHILFENSYNSDFPNQSAFIWSNAIASENNIGKNQCDYPYIHIGGHFNQTAEANEYPYNVSFSLAYCAAEKSTEAMLTTVRKTSFKETSKIRLNNVSALLDNLQIESENNALDAMINMWAPYQMIMSRLYGRTGFYQCGGAFGFRDQLQDACAAALYDTNILKKQIFRACRHQFIEGDVQHWWHNINAEKGKAHRGIRTRCSDDLIWLPYSLAHYIEMTGDYNIFSKNIQYIKSEILDECEQERYEIPENSGIYENTYIHAKKALIKGCTFGTHNLPFIGSCDWNDGMSMVGEKGKGESVWLAMFIIMTLEMFLPLSEYMQDNDFTAQCGKWIEAYKTAIEVSGYSESDKWYRRGFFDDGSPFGDSSSEECKIDSIAQSFSVFAGMEKDRASSAIIAAYEHLYDKNTSVVKLFDPPYNKSEKNPGYIKGYLPGTRENGGQYTHAAVWLALSFFKMGGKVYTELGYELLNAINPLTLTAIETTELSNAACERYVIEPYVFAGDVYSNESQNGRGGWSWYTGAAGWYIRAVIEGMCGVRIKRGQLYINPKLPNSVKRMNLKIRIGKNGYDILFICKQNGENIKAYRNGILKETPADMPFDPPTDGSDDFLKILIEY